MRSTSKTVPIIIGLCIIVVVWYWAVNIPKLPDQIPNSAWQEEYSVVAKESGISEDYMASTQYFNYKSPEVNVVVNDIKTKATNVNNAIELTLEWVYNNIEYVNENDQTCFDSSAADTINRGTGQCDTQSTAVVAILRGLGIAARPVGGCVGKLDTCGLLQATVTKNKPRFQEIQIVSGKTEYGRTGGLHAWVEAWTKDLGWVTLESTAGSIADTGCYNYVVEAYPDNYNRKELCVSTDMTFVQMCSKL